MASRPKPPEFPDREKIAAGVDEVGRGCLAGPVVAAAAILPPGFTLPGLTDSKRLSPQKREKFAAIIRENAVWSLGVVWPGRIDATNILRASLEAMGRAAQTLRVRPDLLLIDGLFVIPETCFSRRFYPDQKAIVKGDAKIPAISAASVVAKTFRDKLMRALARRWPGYGFERNAGYGTRAHFEALRRLGPCPLHRRTFRGVVTGEPKRGLLREREA